LKSRLLTLEDFAVIKVNVQRSSDGAITGFKVSGHAGFAEYGEDIVCSAVSAIVLTAVGYAESVYNPKDEKGKRCFTEESGEVIWHCPKGLSGETQKIVNTVFDAMVYGLKQICENYGNKYLVVID
jgi:uncharacterized protein YsxB (DUF464 family)